MKFIFKNQFLIIGLHIIILLFFVSYILINIEYLLESYGSEEYVEFSVKILILFPLITLFIWICGLFFQKFNLIIFKSNLINQINFYFPFIIINTLLIFYNILIYTRLNNYILPIILFVICVLIFAYMIYPKKGKDEFNINFSRILTLIFLNTSFCIVNILISIIPAVGN